MLTHNMLRSPIKGVKIDTFLGLECTKTEEVEAEFNPDFIVGIAPKLDWGLLLIAAEAVRMLPSFRSFWIPLPSFGSSALQGTDFSWVLIVLLSLAWPEGRDSKGAA